jgi:predicted esterase
MIGRLWQMLCASSLSILTALLFLGFSGHRGPCQVPTTQVRFSSPDGEVPITQWQVLGPFRFSQKEMAVPDANNRHVGLNRDYLKEFFGRDEGLVDEKFLSSIKSPKSGAASQATPEKNDPQTYRVQGNYQHDFYMEDDSPLNPASLPCGKALETGVTLDPRFGNIKLSSDPKSYILDLLPGGRYCDYAVSYVAVNLRSRDDQDVIISVGIDDNFNAWLNNKLAFATSATVSNAIRKHHYLIGAHLRRGNNFLLLKAGNLQSGWGVIATILPHTSGLKLAKENGVNPILLDSVVASGHPLVLRGDLLPLGSIVHVKIADARHSVVKKGDIPFARAMDWRIDDLPEDSLYYCEVSMNGQSVTEPFFYGNPDIGANRLSEQLEHVSRREESTSLDLSAMLTRLRHILLPESRKAPWWDQKVAAAFAEGENNLADLTTSERTFLSAPGMHLRGYRSSVDGQVQNYWLYVPEKALRSGKPLPLVIAPPYEFPLNVPFLETGQVAFFNENERYKLMSDEFGFAVLQIWGRGQDHGGTAIWGTDVLESIGAVQRDYPIDVNRIYLTGSSEAGRQALLLAERYPNRFAAVAVIGPQMGLRHPSSIMDLQTNNLWDQYSSPMSQLGNLVNTPVLLIHEIDDDTVPVGYSESFIGAAKTVGVNATLSIINRGGHSFHQDPVGLMRSVFEFFDGKQRSSSSRMIVENTAVQRFGVKKGPLEDAFGGPILLVEGTQGEPKDNSVARGVADEFRKSWRETYFVDCPWKVDAEVNDQDIQNKNLIVVGDEGTNSLLKRVADRLPVDVTRHGISIEGRDINGDHLGYIYISPNPLNPKKYLVVIGMNRWKAVKGWKLIPSRDGTGDYFVFDLGGPAPKQIDAGYFGVTWEQLWKVRWNNWRVVLPVSFILAIAMAGSILALIRRPQKT